MEQMIRQTPDFELLAPMPFATLCFRFKPKNLDDPQRLNQLNMKLLETLNAGGYFYISHTKLQGIYTLRFAIGQAYVTRADVHNSWTLIQETARRLAPDFRQPA
jgi:aromatic-L-amino-acid decarboxylase